MAPFLLSIVASKMFFMLRKSVPFSVENAKVSPFDVDVVETDIFEFDTIFIGFEISILKNEFF